MKVSRNGISVYWTAQELFARRSEFTGGDLVFMRPVSVLDFNLSACVRLTVYKSSKTIEVIRWGWGSQKSHFLEVTESRLNALRRLYMDKKPGFELRKIGNTYEFIFKGSVTFRSF